MRTARTTAPAPHFQSRARRRAPRDTDDLDASDRLAEYQASLRRLGELPDFEGEGERALRSLPELQQRPPPGTFYHHPDEPVVVPPPPPPQMSATEQEALARFVEVLAARSDGAMLGLAELALVRAQVSAGGRAAPPLAAGPPTSNLARAAATDSFAAERLERERFELMAERRRVEQEREALAAQRAVAAEERRELEWVRHQVAASMPDGAAARLQAQHRVMQARVEFHTRRGEQTASAETERARRAEATAARAARMLERNRHELALKLQSQLRRKLARRGVEAAVRARDERRAQSRAAEAEVRARVLAREQHFASHAAAARVQAAERGRVDRAVHPGAAAVREQRERRFAVERQLRQQEAATTITSARRGVLAKREARAKADARELEDKRKKKRHTRATEDRREQIARGNAATKVQAAQRAKGGRRAAAQQKQQQGAARRAAFASGREVLRGDLARRDAAAVTVAVAAAARPPPSAATGGGGSGARPSSASVAAAAAAAARGGRPGKAATRVQAQARGKLARRAVAQLRKRAATERQARADARALKRKARREEQAAVTLQSCARRRRDWRTVQALRREGRLRHDAVAHAARAAAASYLHGDGAARTALRLPPARVVMHAVTFRPLKGHGAQGLQLRRVWVEVELGSGNGRMMRAQTQPHPIAGGGGGGGRGEVVSLEDEELPMPLGRPEVASRLQRLLSNQASPEVDTDLVFTLFGERPAGGAGGAPGGGAERAVAVYLGEAYVNLHDCLRRGRNVERDELQPILDKDDNVVGEICVTVDALAAMHALVGPQSPAARPRSLDQTHREAELPPEGGFDFELDEEF